MDRIDDIRANLNEWSDLGIVEQMRHGDDYADGFADDIAYLLAEVERLQKVEKHREELSIKLRDNLNNRNYDG